MDNLLKTLIKDEKRANKKLYTAGPYWDYKNKKTIYQLRKNQIGNFRGLNSGVGTSYTDNVVLDSRNEYNFKGRIVSIFTKMPIIKKIFEDQLTLTSGHIQEFLSLQATLFKNDKLVDYLIKKYHFINTTEFGCVQKFSKNNKEYSCFYLEVANRVENISKLINFNKLESYFEIGGGFGANIHFLLNNFSNIKKIVYLDVVPNIYVGTQYLKKMFGESVVDYLATREQKKIKFKNNNEIEILCIAPWQIENLEISFDHFHNAASFVEMPNDVIENYISFIKDSANSISLVSYDLYDENTFNPEKLNKFFNNELKIYKHSKLIDELKREDTYLIKS